MEIAVVAMRVGLDAVGERNDRTSLQLFDSSVTESARIAVAAFGSATTLAAVALKFPCRYTGFSDAMVSPGIGTWPSPPLTIFSARRKNS